MSYRKWILWGLLPLVSLAMHWHVFPMKIAGIHAWRQAETASNVQNFYQEDFNPLRPKVNHLDWPENGLKRMEFPVMQWAAAWLYQVFGEDIRLLRGLVFLLGLLSILGMYRLGAHLFKDEFLGLVAAWTMTFSPVFFYYSINPLPDNLALMAGIWGLVFFVRWHREGLTSDNITSAAFLMLAALAKLPFILFFGVPLGYAFVEFVRSRGKSLWRDKWVVIPAIIGLVPVFGWYLKVIPKWQGNGVVGGILNTEEGQFGQILQIFWQNLISTLPELLLNYGATALFLAGVVFMFRNKLRSKSLWPAFALMAAGLAAYYLFEINMISTVHDYYLLPFLPGLFLIVAYGAQQLWKMQKTWARTLVVLCLIVVPVTAALRTFPRWEKKGMVLDLLEYREELRNAVPASAVCLVGHDKSPHIYLYHLNKKGWNLDESNILPEQIDKYMDAGAEYLYSSSRVLEHHPLIQPLLKEKIRHIGVFQVWRIAR